MCLAVLAFVELPQGLWPDFMTTMISNSSNANYYHRFAAIQTLGFLSEFMEGSPLDQDTVGKMLHTSVLNIQIEYPHICKIALSALLRTIPSTAENFKIEVQRDFIMKSGILKALMIDDEEMQELALQSLVEVPAVGYQYITPYLQTIGDFTA